MNLAGTGAETTVTIGQHDNQPSWPRNGLGQFFENSELLTYDDNDEHGAEHDPEKREHATAEVPCA